ncbi:MAG: multicopper oxidase family protein [Actinobacteria bacterium]|nr:multicopper oxidase family protein [Actinomycetota bacterium]MCA1720813.1 multicopper oxidase family protein [Actinomycetota bacterium]
MRAERRRLLVAVAGALAVLVPLGWLWQASRLPGTYSVMDMGYEDTGGGEPVMDHASTARSVSSLVADPARPADVRVELTARKQRFRLASGERVDGYTVNGTSPGPTIRAVEGQLVEVHLTNASVPDGVTLHWHGVDVPNAEDGVAGVTQDAVRQGASFTYRFVVDRAGTYWYHSHQVSHAQVQGGLLGALVVTPAKAAGPEALALLHVYRGRQTINGRTGDDTVPAAAGTKVRVRVLNTDNGAAGIWVSGGAYRVLAVDGYDLHEPSAVRDQTVRLTAGGRVDLEVTAPARVEVGGPGSLVVGTAVSSAPQPAQVLDLLTYGTPAPLPFDAAHADRTFEYSIGRRPGFVNGRPGVHWSINGHLFPGVPMFVVAEGDVVRMHLDNHSGAVHPMHLHGHHAVVLARNGVKASGSPWWVDSLDVANGDDYDIAFVADNPGVWMDHCHNLPHAQQGLIAHLMYEGVTEPFRVGGKGGNSPE